MMTKRYKANVDPSSKESILKFFEEHYDYTTQELHLKYGIPVSTLNYWKRKVGLGTGRPKAFSDYKRPKIEVEIIHDPNIWDNGPWFKEMYQEKKLGAYVIARMINRSVTVVYRRLARYRIPRRAHRESVKPRSEYYDKDWLWTNYIKNNRTLSDISKEVGINTYTLYNWLVDFGIPIRRKGAHTVIKHRDKRIKAYYEKKNGTGVSKTDRQSRKP